MAVNTDRTPEHFKGKKILILSTWPVCLLNDRLKQTFDHGCTAGSDFRFSLPAKGWRCRHNDEKIAGYTHQR
jgi:hypothetical protein